MKTIHESFRKVTPVITTAKLYMMPPAAAIDKIGYIRKQTPIQTQLVTYYDCKDPDPDAIIIVGAPKNPGIMGNTNNPGKPIRWNTILGGGFKQDTVDGATLSLSDPCPTQNIGKYIFKQIPFGEYVLEITRQGFLPRYGVIKVEATEYLGHRELLGGDVNGDLLINEKDITVIIPKSTNYGSLLYDWKYDFNGDRYINGGDQSIIRINLNAKVNIYQEAEDLMNGK